MGHRRRVEPTDDWRHLQLLAPFPEQRAYELLRPVVLFGRSPAERRVSDWLPEDWSPPERAAALQTSP